MRFFISIVCILLLFDNQIRTAHTLIDFYMNRDYVAQNFCENLDKGITSCYGSCYLEKQLKKESENKQHPTFPKTEIEALNYLPEPDVTIPGCVFFSINPGYFEFKNNYRFTTLNTIFHPPKFYT